MDKKTLAWLAAVLDAAIFFLVAFSGLPFEWKLVGGIATLGLGGMYLSKLCGWETWYGISIVRGKYGFKMMDSWGSKHPELFRFLADAGAGAGYGAIYSLLVFRNKKSRLAAALAANFAFTLLLASGSLNANITNVFSNVQFIALFLSGIAGGIALQAVSMLVISAINILTVPNAPPGVQLLIVGVTVPWEWLFGIAIAATIHEFAHGVLCRAEKLRVTSSGAILFGVMPIGAFVEPDEEKFKKLKLEQKRRILAAGPTANLVGFCLFVPLAIIAGSLFASSIGGLQVASINQAYPGVNSLGLGDKIYRAEGIEITGPATLANVLQSKKPGEIIRLDTSEGYREVAMGPDGKLGIYVSLAPKPGGEWWFYLLSFLSTVLSSTAYINIAIASINLLPIFITDGGRLAYEELREAFGENYAQKTSQSKAKRVALALGVATLGIILVNLFLPQVIKWLG